MVVHVDDRVFWLLRHLILRNHHGPGPVFLERQIRRALTRGAWPRLLAFNPGIPEKDEQHHRKHDETWNAHPMSTSHSHRNSPQVNDNKSTLCYVSSWLAMLTKGSRPRRSCPCEG